MSCLPRKYILIIAEKPKAAKKIVEAFSSYKSCRYYNVNYWIINNEHSNIVVASAVGHLFNLSGNSGFPVFDVVWRPLWEIDKKSYFTKRYYLLLNKLCKNATEYINACDYDIEGSVIGYMIIKNFGDIRRAKRMKFSSLTKQEILNAFHSLQPLDINMVEAGIARHVVDWIWGINISRALMLATREVSKKQIILSAGRVQSPTLIHVIENYLDRELFVPLPYYKIKIDVILNGRKFSIFYEKEFPSLQNAKDFAERLRKDKLVIKEISVYEEKIPRPSPFNLGDLQFEAGRLFGLSPYKVERIAENLYLDGLISYPRTNSQKIPSTVNIHDIVKGLFNSSFRSLINKLNSMTNMRYIVRQGIKDDPAHPAIYPTGIVPKKQLSEDEWKVYELIVRRFLASISVDAILEKQKIYLNFINNDIEFVLQLQKLINKGWLDIYPYRNIESEDIVNVNKGDEVKISSISTPMLTTKPNSRLTRVSLLKWMEESKIGTEATRGKIIETLFQRKYVENKRGYIYPTKLGIIIAEVLKDYFNELTNVKLTAEIEDKLNEIIFGRTKKEDVIEETKKRISSYISLFSSRKTTVGEKISKGLGIIKYNNCKLCNLESTENGFCEYHNKAISKLHEAIKIWKERTGYDESTILKIIKGKKSTGKLISDIIKYNYR
ncbi:DNA topoisomerase I [Acidianus sulfidivorans JP7]|uniref:DNA topoisomerase n=1 Tax=Acidianus sulfidivorans JP7 TaxID=619593 RepID=A0A2U9INX7_9CREN|nr:DNA topoisomerase I [Acidianus sulfidivorans]AWR97748.1 DNA topoisomerase I [Acidianus sulfidivorans JP7]